MKLQNKGGKFILRLGDIYTSFTVKIINILHDCYKEIYLFKPCLVENIQMKNI